MDFCIETEKAAEVGLCLDLFRPVYTWFIWEDWPWTGSAQEKEIEEECKYDVNRVALGIMGVKAISNLSKCNRKNSPFVYLIHPAKQEISHKCNLLIEDNGSYSPTK